MLRRLKKTGRRRQSASDARAALIQDGWEFVNKYELNRNFSFQYHGTHAYFARINNCPKEIGSIFDLFLTEDLIREIVADSDPECWIRRGHSNERIIPRLTYIYKVLAAYVYIMGHRGIFPGVEPGKLDLGASMAAAINFLSPHAPPETDSPFPGQDVYYQILANFHIPYGKFAQLSTNFQSIIQCLGEVAAGDEKLFHFTGDTLFKRVVLEKPDRVGLWLYELCVRLKNGGSYLVHLRLQDASSRVGTSVPVSSVVQ